MMMFLGLLAGCAGPVPVEDGGWISPQLSCDERQPPSIRALVRTDDEVELIRVASAEAGDWVLELVYEQEDEALRWTGEKSAPEVFPDCVSAEAAEWPLTWVRSGQHQTNPAQRIEYE